MSLSHDDIKLLRHVALTRPVSFEALPELDALKRRNLLIRMPQAPCGYKYDLSRAGMKALHKAQRPTLKRRWE